MRTKEMSQISSWNREGAAGVSAAAMLSLAAQQCNKELHYYELWLMFSIVVHQHSQKMVASTSIIITGIMPKSKSRGWVFLLYKSEWKSRDEPGTDCGGLYDAQD